MKGESKRKIKSKDDAKVLALVVRKQEMGKSAGRLGFRVEIGNSVLHMLSYLSGDVNMPESWISECGVGEGELDWRPTFSNL